MSMENDNNFEVNDPKLLDAAPPEFDGDADLQPAMLPAPPDDGEHVVFVNLVPEGRNASGQVYVKSSPDRQAVLYAVVTCRVANAEGEPGMYLKDKWVGSQVFEGQTTSDLAYLLKLIGRPMPRFATFKDMKEYVEGVFAAAPEEGYKVKAKTRWIKSVVATDGDGNPIFTNEKKQYIETKGQKKITHQNVEAWMRQGVPSEAAVKKAHLYVDPIDGEERSVRAEVAAWVGSVE